MQNKYYIRSRISEGKFREIIHYFCHDETASKTAIYTKISRVTINKIFNQIRKKIFLAHTRQEEKSSGIFELDESYFGAKRVRGKRGRGASGKTPVFGLLKRDGKFMLKLLRTAPEHS